MANDAQQCTVCDRQLWPEDRFCAECGTATGLGSSVPVASVPVPGDDSDGGFAFESPVSTVNESQRSSRRESLVGIAVLVAIIGGIALFFLVGNGAASDLASEDPAEATAVPAEVPTESAAVPTEEPSVTDDEAARAEEAVGEEATEAEPTPTPVPMAGLADFVREADLGEGWIVLAGEQGRPFAMNLGTLETIELESTVGDGIASFVTEWGVFAQVGPFGDRGRSWIVEPWGPGSPETVELTATQVQGDVFAVLDDPDVGLVAIAAPSFGDTNVSTDLRAHSLLTGETKDIELADPLGAILTGLLGVSPNLQQPVRRAFFSDAGDAVFRWSWSEGWVEIAKGELSHTFGDRAIVKLCSDPSRCEQALIDRDGQGQLDVPTDVTAGAWWDVRLAVSPDGRKMARVLERTNPTTGENEAALMSFDLGDDAPPQMLLFDEGLMTDSQFTWSPKGEYVLLDSGRRVVAIEVASGEMTELGTRLTRPSLGGGVVFLDEIAR